MRGDSFIIVHIFPIRSLEPPHREQSLLIVEQCLNTKTCDDDPSMVPRFVLFLVSIGACLALRWALPLARPRPDTKSLRRLRPYILGMTPATNSGSNVHALLTDIQVHSIPEETTLSNSDLDKWDTLTKEFADKVRKFPTKSAAVEAYSNLLFTLAKKILDPLQITSFEVITNAVVDSLIQTFPKDTPVTSLIEELTDLHHCIIADIFERKESSDEAEDLSTKADRLQYLAYQFAGLAQYTYTRIGLSLGEAFDTTESAQELRRNVWLAPVLSRLQRACVMFSASEAEERIQEQRTQAFDSLLRRIHFQISPKYTLFGGPTITNVAPSTSLPAWDLAHFVQKVLRNSVLGMDLLELEQKVLPVLREAIAERMRGLVRPLEQITLHRSQGLDGVHRDVQAIEQLVNLGHESVAAVLVLWQVRHNIVGVAPSLDVTASAVPARVGEQMRVKDYLRPVALRSVVDGSPVKPSALLDSVPAYMRGDVAFTVSEVAQSLAMEQPPRSIAALYNIALLAEAVRRTAGEEFRALSTYNMDTDQLPSVSRDDMYVTVLAAVLAHYLRCEHPACDDMLYEHLLAFAALEETWGVREPRASAAAALRQAISDVAMGMVVAKVTTADAALTQADQIAAKVAELEHALGMVLRLPEGEGEKCRLLALESIFDQLFPAEGPGGLGTVATTKHPQKLPIKQAMEAARRAGAVFGVEPVRLERFLLPRKLAIFDRAVQELLMNADVAVSMPALSEVFENQVYACAEGLGMTTAEAMARAAQLASAALATFLVTVARDATTLGAAKVDVTLTKCMYISEHPFWSRSAPVGGGEGCVGHLQVLDSAVATAAAKLGRGAALELIRALDAARIRATGNEGGAMGRADETGWGRQDGLTGRHAAVGSTSLASFIQAVQRAMLREYSTAR